eukprot:gene4378-5109_t
MGQQGAEMWALVLQAPAVRFAPGDGGCGLTRAFVSADECAAFAPQALRTPMDCWS